ncbi:unnamed protein product, partial [Meganyctiphanes norvegica]
MIPSPKSNIHKYAVIKQQDSTDTAEMVENGWWSNGHVPNGNANNETSQRLIIENKSGFCGKDTENDISDRKGLNDANLKIDMGFSDDDVYEETIQNSEG